jgi:hypothetical protein
MSRQTKAPQVLERVVRRALSGKGARVEAKNAFEGLDWKLAGIRSHNSYHLGQVVLLRRMRGVWPPPGGGLTW